MAKSPTSVRKGARFREVSYAEMSDYLRFLRQNEAYLLSFPGVEEVDIGYRWVGKQLTDEITIRVHVARKRDDLEPDARVPEQLAGMKVDVIASCPALHAVRPKDLKERVRPVRAGLEIANAHCEANGTLGAIVYDRVDGSPLLLSNHHVLVRGSVDVCGERVSQPGTHLGRDEIGRIVRTSPYFDAAVATLSDGVAYSREVPGIPGGIKGVARPSLGMTVTKVGAATGSTRGLIESVSVEGFTVIPIPRQKWTEISAPGDSGAVWVDMSSHAAVGLHFAGENVDDTQDERAWAFRADLVSDALDVDFCKVTCLPEYPRFAPSLASNGDDLLVAWVASRQVEVDVKPKDEGLLDGLQAKERRRSRDYDTERRRSRGRDYDTERLRSRGRNYDTERQRSRGRDYDTERVRSRGRDYDTERLRSRGRDYDTERVRSRGRDYDTERLRSRGRNYDTERMRSRGRDYDTEAKAGASVDWGTVWLLDGEGREGRRRVEQRWVNVRVLSGRDHLGPVTTLNIKPVGELALTVFNGKYVMAWTTPSGVIQMRSSEDGVTWGDAVVIPETMSDYAPTLTVFKGAIYLAWHADDGRVWMASSRNLTKWSEPDRLDQDLAGGPVLVSTDARLYLAGCAKRSKRMWLRSSSNGQRFNKASTTDAKPVDRPGLCIHGGRLHVAYRLGDDARIRALSTRTGAAWDDRIVLNEWGRTSPGLCSHKSELIYAWPDDWSGRLTLMGCHRED